jgi:hypothetical protein
MIISMTGHDVTVRFFIKRWVVEILFSSKSEFGNNFYISRYDLLSLSAIGMTLASQLVGLEH